MNSADIESLAKSILGPDYFVDSDELDYAVKWIRRGPLATTQNRQQIAQSVETIVSSVADRTNDLLTVQGLAKRILKKFSRANELLYVLAQTDRKQRENAPCLTMPVVSLNSLASSLIPSPQTCVSTFSELEKFLFGPNLSAQDFVCDLVFVIQGIDGKYVRFASSSKLKILCPTLLCPSFAESLILAIGQHGTLIRSIMDLFENKHGVDSLKQAIESELNQFKSVAAVIEQDVNSWTLIRMMAFLTIPIRKLRFLGNIVAECLQSKNLILDTLYTALKRGVFRTLIERIFEALARQWLARVELWVTRGELVDDGIFFITDQSDNSWEKITTGPKNLSSVVDQITKSGHYIWTRKFSVNEEMVPKFLRDKFNPELVHDIFVAGKSMALLRSENSWIGKSTDVDGYRPFQALSELESDLAGFSNNSILVDLITNKHELLQHLLAVKKVFLFGCGELYERFLSQGLFFSTKPLKEFSKFDVINVFDTAGDGLMIPHFDRIDIGLVELKRGDVLESIRLEYLATSPVDVILDPDTVRKYGECWEFLFGIVRVDHGLRQSWRSLMSLDKRLSNGVVYLAGVDVVLRDMNYLRSNLWSWVSQLRFILMVDVVEKEWDQMVGEMGQMDSLDGLVACHERFVSNVQRGLFLDLDQHEVKEILQDAVDVIKRFLNCEGAIYTEVSACMQLDQDIAEFRQRNILALIKDISDSFDEITRIFRDSLTTLKGSGSHYSQTTLINRILSTLG